jgi:hypothetical protein
VRTGCRDREPTVDLELCAVDDDDLGRLADVRVDAVAFVVVDRPARPSRQREPTDHAHRVQVDNRGGAVLAERLAEVERVQTTPSPVVGEPVRMRPHVDAADQLLV